MAGPRFQRQSGREVFFLSGLRFAYRYFRYSRTRYHARTEGASPTLLIGRAADAEILPNDYLRIDTTGLITLYTHKTELGQGIATALALTNTLWRLAWRCRRVLAILRTTGFPAFSLMGYLLAQAGGITLLGVCLGGLFTFAFIMSVKFAFPSFTIVPRLEPKTALSSLEWIAFLTLAGSLLPAWWLSRLNLAKLLHSE